MKIITKQQYVDKMGKLYSEGLLKETVERFNIENFGLLIKPMSKVKEYVKLALLNANKSTKRVLVITGVKRLNQSHGIKDTEICAVILNMPFHKLIKLIKRVSKIKAFL